MWAQSIVDAIGACRVFVVVFSSSANRSGHIVNEVDAAVRKGAMVIPFRIENVMPEGAMEYHLRTRHWLDALSPELNRHLDELAATVRKLLRKPPAAPDQTEFMRLDAIPKPAPPASSSKSRPALESTDSGFHVKVPKVAVTGKAWRTLAVVAVALVGLGAWLFRDKPVVTGVPFEVRSSVDGNSWSVRLTVNQIRFFEGRPSHRNSDNSRPPSPPRKPGTSTRSSGSNSRPRGGRSCCQ